MRLVAYNLLAEIFDGLGPLTLSRSRANTDKLRGGEYQ